MPDVTASSLRSTTADASVVVPPFPPDRVTTDERGTTAFWSSDTLYREIIASGRVQWSHTVRPATRRTEAGFSAHVSPRGAVTLMVHPGPNGNIRFIGAARPGTFAQVAVKEQDLGATPHVTEHASRQRLLECAAPDRPLPRLLWAWKRLLEEAVRNSLQSITSPILPLSMVTEMSVIAAAMHREIAPLLDVAAREAALTQAAGRLDAYNLMAGRPRLADMVAQLPPELRSWPELVALEACVDPDTGDIRRGMKLATVVGVILDACGMEPPRRLVRSTLVPPARQTAFREPDPPLEGWTEIPVVGRGTQAFLRHWTPEIAARSPQQHTGGFARDRASLVRQALAHETTLATIGLERVQDPAAWEALYGLLSINATDAVLRDLLLHPDACVGRMLASAARRQHMPLSHYQAADARLHAVAATVRRFREARAANEEAVGTFARAESIARWLELTEDWHVRLREQELAERMGNAEAYPGPYPELAMVATIGATFRFTPLRSGPELATEGISMSHSLGTEDHLEAASAGDAFYVRLDHRERVGQEGDAPDDPYRASLELDERGRVLQVYGFNDADLLPHVREALEADLDALLVVRGATRTARAVTPPAPRAAPRRRP